MNLTEDASQWNYLIVDYCQELLKNTAKVVVSGHELLG
jgi:hypothetical protein